MSIKITMTFEQRQKYINNLLELDGLKNITENPYSSYCPVSLTSTPDLLKDIILSRQNILMNKILKPAGITAYDPATAPYSPDKNLTSQPKEIYLVDSTKIVSSCFFVGHNILPSTGQGIELEKAKNYNRIIVMLMDKKIRVGRMLPPRAIYLQYTNIEKQAEEFVNVFKLLLEYNPTFGFNNDTPVLLGIHKQTGEVCDLEELVYDKFEHLQYKYDGTKPIVKLEPQNLGLFG